MKEQKKPYSERSDLERIESQWNKLSGLHTREEWSAAMVRAATAAEIAANLAIRKEFQTRSQFDAELVDEFLRWANGLGGKIQRLLIPLTVTQPYALAIANLRQVAERIGRARNEVVHQGHFCNDQEAKATIDDARHFVETLVKLYEPEFSLKEHARSE